MKGSLVVVKIGELHELLLRRERADFLCRGLSNRSTCHANEANGCGDPQSTAVYLPVTSTARSFSMGEPNFEATVQLGKILGHTALAAGRASWPGPLGAVMALHGPGPVAV